MLKIKYFTVFLLSLCFMGCGTSRNSSSIGSNKADSGQDASRQDVILYLSGLMSYDSLTAKYHIDIQKQQRFAGRMNLNGKATEGEAKEINYLQVDASGNVISQHVMDNPLIQTLEYAEKDTLKMKTTIRSEAELYLRIQLDPNTREISFRNGKEIIKNLLIE